MSKTFGNILWFCPNAHAPSWSFPKYVRANSSERGGLSTQSIARKPSVLLRVLRERTSEERESCLVWKRPSRQKVTLAFENAPAAHRLFDTSLGLGDRQTTSDFDFASLGWSNLHLNQRDSVIIK